jgi:predicted nucleotidyltransferase component of viral defense system
MTANVDASVKARLLARAKAAGEEFERMLVRYADERLLYRLGASGARDRCLLKGASLLSVWLPDPYRATRDIDLLAFGASDDRAIRELMKEVCGVACPEDGLRFDLSAMTVETIRAEDEYAGKRARFLAWLGKARISVQIDIGTGDTVAAGIEEIEFPVLLKELPKPRVRAYPREATIAEKFEAMVKLDTRNSRVKDFHDVWALSASFAFNGPLLREAVASCFERRGTPLGAEIPHMLTPPFYEMPEIEARWSAYLRAGAVLVPPPARFTAIGERVRAFLGPVRESIVGKEPFEMQWPAGGPWRVAVQSSEGARTDV